MAKELQSGVLFSTYSTLVSATAGQKAKGGSRLSQLTEWCGGPAFEGLLLDWSALSVRLEPADVPHLPQILRALAANGTALREKRHALALEWTRLLWREALPGEIAGWLRGAPDAFDSVLQSIWLRWRFGLRGDGAAWRPGGFPAGRR